MIHFLFTMHAARHALESGQYVVADGRDAKRQQYRLGVAQCVELATQVDREFVEGLLQRPTLAVEFPKKKSRTRSVNPSARPVCKLRSNPPSSGGSEASLSELPGRDG